MTEDSRTLPTYVRFAFWSQTYITEDCTQYSVNGCEVTFDTSHLQETCTSAPDLVLREESGSYLGSLNYLGDIITCQFSTLSHKIVFQPIGWTEAKCMTSNKQCMTGGDFEVSLRYSFYRHKQWHTRTFLICPRNVIPCLQLQEEL